MSGEKAVVVSCNMITPYGLGVDACFRGILSGKSALSKIDRFNTEAFQSDYGGIINGLHYHHGDSLVFQMVKKLFIDMSSPIPEDSRLILATTKGEIDLLEKALLKGKADPADCGLNLLLNKLRTLTGVKDRGMVISAACASSTVAMARAAAMIRSGLSDSVVVIACDSVTEFVFSGFSSLMALDEFPARPFDKKRSGLTPGEAAAFALIMSETRALNDRREILGEIAGWGASNDATHMTAPCRYGSGLERAVRHALSSASVKAEDVNSISAHGTGTVFNDAMEMKVFNKIFKNHKRTVYSIKGAIGHTLGAAGLIEMLVALMSLREKIAPPTVNLVEPDEDAAGWVSSAPLLVKKNTIALSTNAGFGGINSALVICSE